MGEERVERRLAAILAADVVGYSRLMGQDEAGTLARLRGHRRELIDPSIVEHKGRIVKTTGDGILIEFPSVVEAVASAVAVQRGWPSATQRRRRTSRSYSALGSISATSSLRTTTFSATTSMSPRAWRCSPAPGVTRRLAAILAADVQKVRFDRMGLTGRANREGPKPADLAIYSPDADWRVYGRTAVDKCAENRRLGGSRPGASPQRFLRVPRYAFMTPR